MNSMQWVLASAVLCAGLLAGCDSAQQPVEKSAATAPSGAVPPGTVPPKAKLSSTATKSKDNLPPIQGQVDTREPAQRRDFEKKR